MKNPVTDLHTTDHLDCLQLLVPRFPTRTERKHSQLNGPRHYRKPDGVKTTMNVGLSVVTYM